MAKGAWALAALGAAWLASAGAKAPLSLAAVPTTAEVDAADAHKLTECLLECALNPASVLAPFTGCYWHTGEDDKKSACSIRKACFVACFEGDDEGAVYTNRYNIERTSAPPLPDPFSNFVVEPTFTKANVNATSFGINREYPTDGAVYAQPLYAPDVKLDKGRYADILVIATEFNSVYGFDADTGEELWKTSLTIGRVVNASDIPDAEGRPRGPCRDIDPYYGITGTPAIDRKTLTVYAVSYSVEGANVTESTHFRLNALDLRTGKHREGSPTAPIAASRTFPNSGFAPPQDTSVFRGIKQLQRPGLALYKGQLYIAFGSHCDRPPYWPWLFAFDPASLKINSFWTTPPFLSRANPVVYGGGTTIWMGGTAPSFKGDHVYFVTGRGPVDPAKGGYGNAIMKLSLDLEEVQDYFIPANGVFLDTLDQDLGSGGAIIIKEGKFVIVGGKQGPLYLAKADALGGYDANANNTNVYQVIRPQALDFAQSATRNTPSLYSGAAYWAKGTGSILFRGRYTDPNGGATLYRYAFDANDRLSETPTAQARALVGLFRNRASNPVIQAVSADAEDAILWEIDEQSSLFGWDATSLTPLFTSNNTAVCGGTRSSSGGVVKFALPVLTSGRLYMGCGNKVLEYGLKQ